MNKHLIENAIHEIESLRRQNEILSAQMGVIEVFAAALGLRKDHGGMAPDVVWALRQELNAPPAPGEERKEA